MTEESTPLAIDRPEYETSLGYMLKLSGPMIVSTVSFTIMQFVDRVMISRLGTDALVATNAVLAYTILSAMPIVGVATALSAIVGKAIGTGRKELAVK